MRNAFDFRDESDSIRGTNDDASACKYSAVKKGYYEDEFVGCFVDMDEWVPRGPLMNRGYYGRVKAIQGEVQKFLEAHGGQAQVVLLGGGFDTMYFRDGVGQRWPEALFFELDFAKVTTRKQKVIHHHPVMSQMVNDKYRLVSGDLSDCKQCSEALLGAGLDVQRPCLFVSECVLIYVDPVKGSELIAWAAATFETCSFVCYEQIRPDDAFGRTMISNLKRSNIPLHSLKAYPDLDAQRKRYVDAGFSTVATRDMLDVFSNSVTPPPPCPGELLDEYEEFNMLMQHYCLIVASK